MVGIQKNFLDISYKYENLKIIGAIYRDIVLYGLKLYPMGK